MSQENVERFVEGVEAMNREDVRGALRHMDPDVHFEHWLAFEQSGLDGMRAFMVDLIEQFGSWRIDCHDVRDLGEVVLAMGIVRSTAKGSGAESELPYNVVARFREGRITRFTDYGDRARALAAVGLSE